MKNFKILVLLLLVSPILWADVNKKNGDYSLSQIDITQTGKVQNIRVERMYNSNSTYIGWFGLGWGSIYETSLNVYDDGSIVVNEKGSAGQTRYTSDFENTLEPGTILESKKCGAGKLYITDNGYKRIISDDKDEYFNGDGKLIYIIYDNHYIVDINYKDNRVHSITDSQNKLLLIDWNSEEKIKSIAYADKNKVYYKYEDEKLIQAVDVFGDGYQYAYNNDDKLINIRFENEIFIKYLPESSSVSEIINEYGDMTKYDYGSDYNNPERHFWMYVTREGNTENPIINKYEYELGERSDGSHYTYRIVTEVNRLKTETIYDECCLKPLEIKRGNQVTSFKYNDDGQLIHKSSTRGDLIEIEYHNKFNKITRVVTEAGWNTFEYDTRGNLALAQNNEGRSIQLYYDRKDRITMITEHNDLTKNERTLAFEYNELDKPIEIKMINGGKIDITYDEDGEINSVNSDDGHKMALQVTQVFQSLLALVKPAGVNLNL